jgi:hypothetical protein
LSSKRLIVLSLLVWLAATSRLAMAEVESWYTYWGLGFAGHTYEEPLDSLIQAVDSQPGVSRSQVAYDLLGFYWPLRNGKTMAGFVLSGTSDRLEDAFGNYAQINQNLYGGSVMHFFGREIGDGFFLRGDLGLAKATVDSTFTNPVNSDTGTGVLLGLGYGIAVSEQSRVLITLTASSNHIEGHDYASTALRIGGLW